ncbi:hypothetical protein F8M41_013266 [Gigaspora margarita]|uniref:Uncharacterized protein n=1 Tax=Gigaspora margarita TaxID=4874 RepID=A0A8H4EP36_GIGMA|nr:hypothetical protein F8M41_013266 [Gigaspora margarita]
MSETNIHRDPPSYINTLTINIITLATITNSINSNIQYTTTMSTSTLQREHLSHNQHTASNHLLPQADEVDNPFLNHNFDFLTGINITNHNIRELFFTTKSQN